MLFTRWFIALAVVFAFHSAHAENSLTVTKVSSDELDVKKEVIAFYEKLIADDPKVRAEHDQLVEAASDEASRASQATSDIQTVEWTVSEYSRQPRNQDPRSDTQSESTYLTFEQIMLPFHYGYTAPKNIVGKFRVLYKATDRRLQDEPPIEYKLITNAVTITFQGFQTMDLQPAKN